MTTMKTLGDIMACQCEYNGDWCYICEEYSKHIPTRKTCIICEGSGVWPKCNEEDCYYCDGLGYYER